MAAARWPSKTSPRSERWESERLGILASVSFGEDLEALGFRLDHTSRGAEHYARSPNAYLTYWVHVRDERATFSWEFAISEYAVRRGLQIGSGETLNTFMYPRNDSQGPLDSAWVAREIEQAEALLASVSFVDAED